jgi:flagellar hook assembly protein FlgD
LDLGYKNAGTYADKNKAAHWDGKNEAGENVSSGVYLYVVEAGKEKLMRKMYLVK